MQRKVRVVDQPPPRAGGYQKRKGIEIAFDARAVLGRRQDLAMALRGEAEFLQRLAIELDDDRLGPADEAE